MARIDVNGGAVQSTGNSNVEVINGAMDAKVMGDDVVTLESSKADTNIDVNGVGAVTIVGGVNVVGPEEHHEARLIIQADVTFNGEVDHNIIRFTPGIAGKVTFSDGSSMEWDGQNMVDNTRNVTSFSFISCSEEAQLFYYDHDYYPDGGGEGMLVF